MLSYHYGLMGRYCCSSNHWCTGRPAGRKTMTAPNQHQALASPHRTMKRATCTNSHHMTISLLFLLALLPPACLGARHSFVTRGDSRTVIGPIGAPFGFLTGGIYNLTVFDFDITTPSSSKEVEAGFILKRFDSESAFAKYEQELSSAGVCAFQEYRNGDEGSLFGDDEYQNDGDDDEEFRDFYNVGIDQSASDGIFLSMRNRSFQQPATPFSSHEFDSTEEGLYFLIYQICSNHTLSSRVMSTFELDIVCMNYDKLGYASYLTAGEMPLPLVFLYFSISYGMCLLIWANNIHKIQSSRDNNTAKVYPIHHLMTVLLAIKTCSVLFESIRYHYIRISGHAELWTVVYYTLAFIKGTFLFTVILLIGSGWSFVKPFLNDKEKKVVFVVLVLQVIDNIAVVVLSHETEGESWYDDWSAVLHLVDILCCCAVLVPIVWQVNSMEKALGVEDDDTREEEQLTPRNREENESVRALSKLRLFRSFYLLVVGYIYFTRIIVYLFSTTLGYRHTWVRYAVTELGTLLFYVITGFLFKPMEDNPYLALKKDEPVDNNEEATLEMGKLEMNLKD